MFEHFIIGPHFLERYKERIQDMSDSAIKHRIKQDLHFSKIKKIINVDEKTRHVYTRYSQELVFHKKGNNWILVTIVKHNRKNINNQIARRESQKVV